MSTMWILLAWYFSGLILIGLVCWFDPMDNGVITLRDLCFVFLGAILGPVLPIIYVIAWVNRHGDMVIIRRPPKPPRPGI